MDYEQFDESSEGELTQEQIDKIRQNIAKTLGIPLESVGEHVIKDADPEMIQQMTDFSKHVDMAHEVRNFFTTVLGHTKSLVMLAHMNQMRGLNYFDAQTNEDEQLELLKKYHELCEQNRRREFSAAAEAAKAENPDMLSEESVHAYAVASLKIGAKELREIAGILDDIRGMYDPDGKPAEED